MCKTDTEEEDHNATVKPSSLSFPEFLFLNLTRFDTNLDSYPKKMNTRACTYPMELNMFEYLNEE